MSRATPTIEELFKQHGNAVYRRALRILGSPADAEEATQEIFLRAFQGIEGFRERSGVTTWLYQITTHYCLNHLRNKSRRQELQDALGTPPSSREPQAAANPEDFVLVRKLLANADEREARAAVYVFLDGMSHEEAGEVLGVSRRTIGNLLERFERWAREQTSFDATRAVRGGKS